MIGMEVLSSLLTSSLQLLLLLLWMVVVLPLAVDGVDIVERQCFMDALQQPGPAAARGECHY
jgi:hypothetical protein